MAFLLSGLVDDNLNEGAGSIRLYGSLTGNGDATTLFVLTLYFIEGIAQTYVEEDRTDDTIRGLEIDVGISPNRFFSIMFLAYLAPDIIEAIHRGDIPATLSLDLLKKGFPFDWNEQRKMLGFKH